MKPLIITCDELVLIKNNLRNLINSYAVLEKIFEKISTNFPNY
jgi:hypothetical protein